MAPSSQATRRQKSRQQPTLSTFNRVSKSAAPSKLQKQKDAGGKQLALERLENERKPSRSAAPSEDTPKKRKRDVTDDEVDHESKDSQTHESTKRTKLQLLSPPRTPTQKESPLPAEAQEVASMFSAFCKAFALHRAHNGPSSPAELTALLQAVTRLYRKRAVSDIDLQRILGVFEDVAPTSSLKDSVRRTVGPFKLSVVGSGLSRRRVVDYVGFEDLPERGSSGFNEQELQNRFDTAIRESFLRSSASLRDRPVLDFELGVQTAARQTKTTDTMKHIMSGRKQDLSMGNLSISDPTDAAQSKTIKARTLSLFDRVKAKQLANSTINTPSAEALRRKHALARMAEIVEILRMKQQQKLGGYRGAGSGGKVSFAMQQIISELKASMAIPMADDEVKLCLEILSTEIKDGWCSIFELGATKSVVLTGTGRSGLELSKLIKV